MFFTRTVVEINSAFHDLYRTLMCKSQVKAFTILFIHIIHCSDTSSFIAIFHAQHRLGENVIRYVICSRLGLNKQKSRDDDRVSHTPKPREKIICRDLVVTAMQSIMTFLDFVTK
jgi:hypothetical protein